MPVEHTKWLPDSDILYLRLLPGAVAKTLERKPEILVDVDEHGSAVGIEVVGASSTPVTDLFQVFMEFGIMLRAGAIKK